MYSPLGTQIHFLPYFLRTRELWGGPTPMNHITRDAWPSDLGLLWSSGRKMCRKERLGYFPQTCFLSRYLATATGHAHSQHSSCHLAPFPYVGSINTACAPHCFRLRVVKASTILVLSTPCWFLETPLCCIFQNSQLNVPPAVCDGPDWHIHKSN